MKGNRRRRKGRWGKGRREGQMGMEIRGLRHWLSGE